MTLSPLHRLQVNDGMLITADHWQIAHSYHRQRQTLHYEALFQGGIASGLGISLGPIPETAPSKYRQPRWLTIQPGLAIDDRGNPIVVASPESCYLSAQPVEETTLYIVLKHSELSAQAAVIQEAFQILEKDVPAEADEVELCRIRMAPGAAAIALPDDVFSPALNQLDLRYRQAVQPRARLSVRVASWFGRSEAIARFESLFGASKGLYPPLSGQVVSDPLRGDLIHLAYDEFAQLSPLAQHQLAQHCEQGGTILVEANGGRLGELYRVEAALCLSVAEGQSGPDASLLAAAKQELADIQTCIAEALEQLAAPLREFAETLPERRSPQSVAPLAESLVASEMRQYPFSFGQMPAVCGRPVGLYGWGALLLLVGPLPQAWAVGEGLPLPREEIRSAQELGINLLSFAARRRQMHQCLAPAAVSGSLFETL